ncbi:MAG TPA: DNA-J related domain-containing protein [Cellvibrionaceae bacterium]
MHTIEAAADLLCARLAVFFTSRFDPVQEYQLLTRMQTEGLLAVCADDNYWVALFRKHFLLRHSLYKLNDVWAPEGRGLRLGPISIEFFEAEQTLGLPSEDITYRALADYYGDLNHWLCATEDTCRNFIDDFFKRFAAVTEVDAHLAVLDLPKDAVWGVVQQRYRQLVQQHHPDKGGDVEQFLIITRAFQALKLLRG